MKINPAHRPFTDDRSDRYVAAQCNAQRAAAHADDAARARQVACHRNWAIRASASVRERLIAAARHMPFYLDQLSDGFFTSVVSYDEYDGW
eukprot:833227-Pyramimonas_sp.AAC.1